MGTMVRIHSLVGRCELNGESGVVVSAIDPAKGRVGVKIEAEANPIALKPANLEASGPCSTDISDSTSVECNAALPGNPEERAAIALASTVHISEAEESGGAGGKTTNETTMRLLAWGGNSMTLRLLTLSRLDTLPHASLYDTVAACREALKRQASAVEAYLQVLHWYCTVKDAIEDTIKHAVNILPQIPATIPLSILNHTTIKTYHQAYYQTDFQTYYQTHYTFKAIQQTPPSFKHTI